MNPYCFLRRMYNYDIEHGRINDTPFRFLKSPKAEARDINYATDKTLKDLDSALSKRWSRFKGDADILCYYLALHTGMRGEEICGLSWKDVHLDRGYIEVAQAMGGKAVILT